MISKTIFGLVVMFGSSTWMGTNSVWMQLPLLTSELPEGWNLPSYLTAVIQIACIGPLVYSIIYKGFPKIRLPTVALILFFLGVASLSQLGLVFLWDKTATVGSNPHSVALFCLLFGLALVDSLSNVLFLPFMSQFHKIYLNAYFVGVGFSALLPSLLSLVQGTGNYDCRPVNGTVVPIYEQPRFSVAIFFLVVFVWTVLAMISFMILYRKRERSLSTSPLDSGEVDEDHNGHFEDPNSASNCNMSRTSNTSIDLPNQPFVQSNFTYGFLLFATALINAQMNGVITSVQSYASLPYSEETYHYGVTFSNIISPIASFVPFFLLIRSLPILAFLTILSSCTTAFILYLAALSPNQIFDSQGVGSALSLISILLAAGLHSYLRIVFISLLREGEQSETRLFWGGVFIQVGVLQKAHFPLERGFI